MDLGIVFQFVVFVSKNVTWLISVDAACKQLWGSFNSVVTQCFHMLKLQCCDGVIAERHRVFYVSNMIELRLKIIK